MSQYKNKPQFVDSNQCELCLRAGELHLGSHYISELGCFVTRRRARKENPVCTLGLFVLWQSSCAASLRFLMCELRGSRFQTNTSKRAHTHTHMVRPQTCFEPKYNFKQSSHKLSFTDRLCKHGQTCVCTYSQKQHLTLSKDVGCAMCVLCGCVCVPSWVPWLPSDLKLLFATLPWVAFTSLLNQAWMHGMTANEALATNRTHVHTHCVCVVVLTSSTKAMKGFLCPRCVWPYRHVLLCKMLKCLQTKNK